MPGGGSNEHDVAALFRKHGPAVYRRARRILGSHHEAEEATQEVFLRVFASLDRFKHQSRLTTWLYQITTNYCLNRLRDQRTQAELRATRAVTGEIHARGPTAPDDLAEVRRVLAAADPREAEAALYVFVDGLSHEEAADLMSVSRRTVGNLVERFRQSAQERPAAPDALPELTARGSKALGGRG